MLVTHGRWLSPYIRKAWKWGLLSICQPEVSRSSPGQVLETVMPKGQVGQGPLKPGLCAGCHPGTRGGWAVSCQSLCSRACTSSTMAPGCSAWHSAQEKSMWWIYPSRLSLGGGYGDRGSAWEYPTPRVLLTFPRPGVTRSSLSCLSPCYYLPWRELQPVLIRDLCGGEWEGECEFGGNEEVGAVEARGSEETTWL